MLMRIESNTPMKTAAAIMLMLALTGCSTLTVDQHAARIDERRASLPYVTRIGLSRSMETVLHSGGVYLVRRQPYHQIQGGQIAVFWPIGWRCPVAHFVGGRVGTDSWSTYYVGGIGDDTNRWILTRDNYIGTIWP
jgi:hypothetical protein